VAISQGRIVAVLPQAEALARYEAKRVVRLDRHALIPGLVNLHCHMAMSLLRGIADDVPLMPWLEKHVWPAEGRHVNDEFVHDGSLLAMAEMLRAGVTCVNDMYFFPEASARAALRAGMRASLGIIAIEFPSAYATDASSYLQKGFATRDAYKGEPLLSFCLAPHAPYTVADETLRRIVVLAEELDLPIHTHVHETTGEIEQKPRAASRPPRRAPAPPRHGRPAADCRARGAPGRPRARPLRARARVRGALPVIQHEARERHRAHRRDAQPRDRGRLRHGRRGEQ
jgi:5-methylthioadenosine/S-adenosylhomocysteine deaminase